MNARSDKQETGTGLAGDEPIETHGQDRFGRNRLARRIEAEARSAPEDGGFVIALCGEWGSGKTSVVNLAMERLRGDGSIEVVAFNPWMISGVEDLVLRVFAELSATLGNKSDKASAAVKAIASYAAALSPIAALLPGPGTAVSAATEVARRVLTAGDEKSLYESRKDLKEALRKLDRRIVVFIDDLDRLTDDEIRDMMRLVKSVGDLPKVSYVLAFDREHVELVLGGPGDEDKARARGRRYLEKIVQVQHDLPRPRRQAMADFYSEQLDRTFSACGIPRPSKDEAGAIEAAVAGLVRTPRHAKRAANALAAGLDLYADEIAVVDLIGLEGLRALEPQVHSRLAENSELFLTPPPRRSRNGNTYDDAIIQERMDAAVEGANSALYTRAVLAQLFPVGQTDRSISRRYEGSKVEGRKRRVSVPRVFWRYVHANLGPTEVSSAEVREAVEAIRDAATFRQVLRRYGDERMLDLLEQLTEQAPVFDTSDVVEIAQVVLAETVDQPGMTESRFWGTSQAEWLVQGLITALLRRLPPNDLDKRIEAVTELFESAPTMSARWRVIEWFATHPRLRPEEVQTGLIEMGDTRPLADTLRNETLIADPETLAGEVEMGFLLESAMFREPNQARARFARCAGNDRFLIALLRYLSAHAEKGEGNHLDWGMLIHLIGEKAARQRVTSLERRVRLRSLDAETRKGILYAAQYARRERRPPSPMKAAPQ